MNTLLVIPNNRTGPDGSVIRTQCSRRYANNGNNDAAVVCSELNEAIAKEDGATEASLRDVCQLTFLWLFEGPSVPNKHGVLEIPTGETSGFKGASHVLHSRMK